MDTNKMSPEFANQLVDAIYKAEGGAKARYPYGIIAKRELSEPEARRWALNTVRNNWARWQKNPERNGVKHDDYLGYLSSVYAPIGADNDPKGLNQNWLGNVRKILGVTPVAQTKPARKTTKEAVAESIANGLVDNPNRFKDVQVGPPVY